MTTALMFRLETNEDIPEDRTGAYQGNNDIATKILGTTLGSIQQPMPWNDGVNERGLKIPVFGFDSLKAYKEWFNNREGRERVKDLAVLAVYEVPLNHMSLGNHQCVGEGSLMIHKGDLPTDYWWNEVKEELLVNATGLPKITGELQ